jgi:hypothetical protein
VAASDLGYQGQTAMDIHPAYADVDATRITLKSGIISNLCPAECQSFVDIINEETLEKLP